MTALLYLLAGVLFILGLRGLGSPRTARRGNQIAAAGMLLASGFLFEPDHPDRKGLRLRVKKKRRHDMQLLQIRGLKVSKVYFIPLPLIRELQLNFGLGAIIRVVPIFHVDRERFTPGIALQFQYEVVVHRKILARTRVR